MKKPNPNRVYLAGPMSGLPDLNFPTFNREAARLRTAGYDVVNPAEIPFPETPTWEQAMRADIVQLVSCGSIALLPGWQGSRGARLEYEIAKALNFIVIPTEG